MPYTHWVCCCMHILKTVMFNKPKQFDFWQLSWFSPACKHPNLCSTGLLKCAYVIWPCSKWHTSYSLVADACTRLWRLRDCMVSQCHFRVSERWLRTLSLQSMWHLMHTFAEPALKRALQQTSTQAHCITEVQTHRKTISV